jgi:hypothetical protein
MGWHEVRCRLCATTFSYGRLRIADEPSWAGWLESEEFGLYPSAGFSSDICTGTGCTYVEPRHNIDEYVYPDIYPRLAYRKRLSLEEKLKWPQQQKIETNFCNSDDDKGSDNDSNNSDDDEYEYESNLEYEPLEYASDDDKNGEVSWHVNLGTEPSNGYDRDLVWWEDLLFPAEAACKERMDPVVVLTGERIKHILEGETANYVNPSH